MFQYSVTNQSNISRVQRQGSILLYERTASVIYNIRYLLPLYLMTSNSTSILNMFLHPLH